MNPGFSPRRWAWLALVAACLPFLAGLPGGFLFDDYPVILEAPAVQMASLTLPALWEAAFSFHPAGGLPRPLVNASFALNYWISGLDPAAFKLVNIALHGLNGVLLFFLLRRLLQAVGRQSDAGILALLGAALWIVHPLQVSTVLYVVQRMEIVYGTFLLIAALSYVELRLRTLEQAAVPWGLAALTLFASALAWTAKENAAVIPFLLLAIELVVFRCRAHDPKLTRCLRWLAGLGIAVGVAAVGMLYAYGLANPEFFSARDFGPMERLAAQAVLLPFYLGLIAFPRLDAMVFYYDHLALVEWPALQVAAGVSLIVLMLVAAWTQRDKRPLVTLGIVWFFLGHLVTSAPLPLELAFEHRNYVPLAGLVLAVIGLIAPVWWRAGKMATVFVALGFAALFAATGLRAAYWSDPNLLARYLVDINPGSMRARMDYGERYMLAANRDPTSPFAKEAVAQFEQVTRLPQGSILAEHALILMAADFGVPAEPWWWASMEEKLKTQPIRPQDADALVGMVEQRLEGVALDDASLLRSTLAAARRDVLSTELLLLFATHAVEGAQDYAGAVELLARGRFAARNDPEYLQRIDDGIERIGGAALLESVNAWQADHLSPPQ